MRYLQVTNHYNDSNFVLLAFNIVISLELYRKVLAFPPSININVNSALQGYNYGREYLCDCSVVRFHQQPLLVNSIQHMRVSIYILRGVNLKA